MCGITGIYSQKSISKDDLDMTIKKMTACLTHRGPDDQGYYIGSNVALGHRRLSIIDLKSGHQPIFNEDKSKCIIFNGEIYNYMEIKNELLSKGHKFTSNSDTETILHAFEEWGEESIKKLRGMFAFCILDSAKDSIFLARDRFGEKPLFYAFYNNKFVFASEIKAILSDPLFRRSIEDESIASYFKFSYIPAPLTIYKNINKLPPGHSLTFERGCINIKQYWDLYYEPDFNKKEREFIPEFMDLLNKSVGIQQISEVPIGAFLSGGIDSSTIVALMSRKSSRPVNTFTIGFKESGIGFEDERKYARLVAEMYNTNHREHEVIPDSEGIIDKIVTSFDEPFADDSTIPSYFICKMARENVTVALSGLGGDEAFCGYERYLGFHISHIYNRLPHFIREKFIRAAVDRMNENSSGSNKINHLKRFVRSASGDNGQRYLGYVSKISERYRTTFFSDKGSNYADPFRSAENRFLKYYDSPNAEDPLNKVFYSDIKTYLPDDILACTDRMSMHHSLEVRVPFLDHKLMEYCATIPPNLKIKWFRKKYLLKKAVSSIVPRSVIKHKKQGFVGPLPQWLKTDMKKTTLDRLSEKNLKKHGLFDSATVKNILNEHYTNKETNDSIIWSLLIFQSWFDLYME